MPVQPIIVWFRQDLRLTDNPALVQAAAADAPVIPLYVLDDRTQGQWGIRGAARWWLHRSLQSLDASLRDMGSSLLLRHGDAGQVIPRLVEETGATAVYWNRCYEPRVIARDSRIKESLGATGMEAKSFNAALLFEPWTIETKTGGPYKVFTPFWRACSSGAPPAEQVDAPKALTPSDPMPPGDTLDDWRLLPTSPDWAEEFGEHWTPGERGAQKSLDAFLTDRMASYPEGRDRPAEVLTSRLSPHLHFGEIGPRQIWQAIDRRKTGAEKFLAEIGWREFAHHLLYHFPAIPEENLRPAFDDFPWRDDADGLKAWQRGRTGYPIVDAGMRQLWRTGWMHNRVRMIAASFLIKDLLIDWREGEKWFWDTLVDADLANNAAGWQWVAGSGADAAPFFRIFNPVTQGEKFDPAGAYVRKFVPEIAALPDKWIHHPWDAPDDVLESAGITPGETYPHPIVDHKAARQRALTAFKAIRTG
tara:strand:- start:543 stop:1967 length:1425 start_codon:yes stop_codon:yes gene_type:complete